MDFTSSDKTVLTFLYTVACLTGVVGNIAVLASICSCKKARNKQCNMFIVSLAATDLLTGSLCGPYYIRSLHVATFFRNKNVGYSLCVAILVVAYALAINSILSLTLLSLDRYCAVKYPFWYKKRITKTKCRVAVLFIWVYSFVVVLPPSVLRGWIAYENEPGSPCGLQWKSANSWYLAFNIVADVALPTLIVSITNIIVFKTARLQNLKTRPIAIEVKRPPWKLEEVELHQPISTCRELQRRFSGLCRSFSNRTSGEFINKQRNEIEMLQQSVKLESVSSESIGNNCDTFCDARQNKSDEPDAVERSSDCGKPDSPFERKECFRFGVKESGASLERTNLARKRNEEESLDVGQKSSRKSRAFSAPHAPVSLASTRSTASASERNESKSLHHISSLKLRVRRNSKLRTKMAARAEMKLALATISLAISFFMSWIPFVAIRVLRSSTSLGITDKAVNYSSIFAFMNSAWNPYVILLTRKEIYRGAILVAKIFCRKLFCKNQDDLNT